MTISLISPSRAEYGPMQSLIAALPEANVVRFHSENMSPAIAMSQGMTYFTAMFKSLNTTRVVVLGDRYESLTAALAAMFLRIPVAHIHGGETTTGAFDDPMRHAMTHIADLHFVATERSRAAVNSLKYVDMHGDGIAWRDRHIHLVGAPGLDGIQQSSAKRDRKHILVTFHPETRAEDYGLSACRDMLDALAGMAGYDITFTGVNFDPGSDQIIRCIRTWMATTESACVWRDGMSHDDYIMEMQHAALVVGNSSAGIIECPWIGIPSVNIGRRQDGRPCAPSVFNWCPGDATPLSEIIGRALGFAGYSNPHYTGNGTGAKIAAILRAAESGHV